MRVISGPRVAALVLALFAAPAAAEKFAVSQYGIVTATLAWAVALEKGFLKQDGLNVESIVGSHGGGTTVRNMLATDLPYAEVGLPAALAARRSGLELLIINNSVNNIGDLAWVARKGAGIKTVQDLKGKKA